MGNPLSLLAQITVKQKQFTVDTTAAMGESIQMQGQFCEDGKLRFGITTLERNRIVSMHYIGTASGDSASGTLSVFGDANAASDGRWKLQRSE